MVVVYIICLILIILSYEPTLTSAIITYTSAQGPANNSSSSQGTNMNSVMLQYLIPAIVAAVASVVAAIIAAWNQTKLQRLQEAKAEQDARRDYEYDARKRLYNELEPLIFLHIEDSDNAYYHIMELANMAKSGILSEVLSENMVGKEDNYYLKATIYKLIRPMAVFRLMQRHLTSYDLELEDYFRLQYTLAKCLYFSCTDDYYVALGSKKKEHPELCLICAFQGYLKHPGEKKEQTSHPNHIVYNILGMTRGVIDNLANSTIRFDKNDKSYRVMTFDEFEEKHFGIQNTKMTPSMKKICELFSGMNPNNRNNYPRYVLLWRILVLHACIYSVMKELKGQKQTYRKHSTRKIIENIIDRSEINTRIASFMNDKADEFCWVVETETEKQLSSGITRDRMNKDYSRSKTAIKEYLDDWLRDNYENPAKIVGGKSKGWLYRYFKK